MFERRGVSVRMLEQTFNKTYIFISVQHQHLHYKSYIFVRNFIFGGSKGYPSGISIEI